MKVVVLRIGHRLVRDDRVTTHAALVARAFGSNKICMTEVDPSIKQTLDRVSDRWGRSHFEIEIIDNWKRMVATWNKDGGKVIHLTMYGINVDNKIDEIRKEDKILVIIGAEKVPRYLYDAADYNIAIGNQPHSEVAALAIFLDRVFEGKELKKQFGGASVKIIPTEKGKTVKPVS